MSSGFGNDFYKNKNQPGPQRPRSRRHLQSRSCRLQLCVFEVPQRRARKEPPAARSAGYTTSHGRNGCGSRKGTPKKPIGKRKNDQNLQSLGFFVLIHVLFWASDLCQLSWQNPPHPDQSISLKCCRHLAGATVGKNAKENHKSIYLTPC